jgi:hypothetical protein
LAGPLGWQSSTLTRGDVPSEVARLREGAGKDIQVMGNGELVQTLIRHKRIATVEQHFSRNFAERRSTCRRGEEGRCGRSRLSSGQVVRASFSYAVWLAEAEAADEHVGGDFNRSSTARRCGFNSLPERSGPCYRSLACRLGSAVVRV